jgi:hypothetical protein
MHPHIPGRIRRQLSFAIVLAAFATAEAACVVLAASPTRAANDGGRVRRPPAAARAAVKVVEIVNALVPSDVGIDVAASVPTAVERLPASLSDLLPLLPPEHRQLIEECARGRLRVKRGVMAFDPLELLDELADAEADGGRDTARDAAPIREFFSHRPVDVATGTGLSDGPYPITFDWAVALDPRTHTLFSFVLNCRD